jgi:branched-chain amino acid transport system substrate-binding protein
MPSPRLALAVLALSLAAGTPAPASAQANAPVRVGIIFPLTGGSSDMGLSALTGAQVAADELNQVGGYLGRPIELVVRDDQADPDTGLRHAQDLVQKEKVVAVIGYCNTGVAARSLDTFQNGKVPLIVPCATGTALTAKYPPAESYLFRTSASDHFQTQFLADEIVRRGLSRVALLVDNTGYGDAGLKDLQAALDRVHLTPVAVVRFKLGVKTLDDEIRELRNSGADCLVGWTVGPEQGVIAASRAAAGWRVPQFGPWTLSHASAYASSAGKVEGTLMVQTVLPNLFLERNSAFLRAYARARKEQPIGSMMSAAQTYDALNLLARALYDSHGDLSGPGLKRALENPSSIYRGVVTTYEQPYSDRDHDPISMNMLWLGTWRNGERAYFYKEDEKRATVIRRKQ